MAIAYTLPATGGTSLSTPVLAGGLTNSSITADTARPYSLTTMDVNTGLTFDVIDRKLQLEAVLDSVFVDIGADVSFSPNKKMMVPDACIMRLSGEAGAQAQVIPLENPLTGPGRIGTDQTQAGYERQTTLEYMKVYYNEYSQAVMGATWGKNFNALDVFKFYASDQPRLSRWFAEYDDKQYHQAVLQTVAEPLTGTGTALSYSYNPNWFIANLDPASQPTYSNTDATFRTNINTAFAAADTGTNGVNANIDLDYLIYLDSFARTNKKIRPVTIGGKQSYVVLLPSPQYYKLLRNSNGQLGEIWTKVNRLSEEEQRFPGIVGRVMSLVIVEDTRYPTITCTNSYTNATHTVEYVEPGNDDSRNKAVYASDSNASWDIGMLLGAGAIVDWTARPLHFETSNQMEYGKFYGKGAFVERGIQLGSTYNTDTAGNLNIKNFGSCILAFTAASLSVVA
jgi:hypothetical protein